MMGTKRKKMDFAGLRRRETYQEIINYLENEQEIIHYPNRTAKFLRESPYLTQLDGEGQRTLEEQQLNALKQQEKEKILREMGYPGTVAGTGGGDDQGGGKGGGKGRISSRAERAAIADGVDADIAEPLEDLTGVPTYRMDADDEEDEEDGVYATDDGDNLVRRFIREQALPTVARGTRKLLYHGAKGIVEYGPSGLYYGLKGAGLTVKYSFKGLDATARYLMTLAREGAPRQPIENYEPELRGSASSGLQRSPIAHGGSDIYWTSGMD